MIEEMIKKHSMLKEQILECKDNKEKDKYNDIRRHHETYRFYFKYLRAICYKYLLKYKESEIDYTEILKIF